LHILSDFAFLFLLDINLDVSNTLGTCAFEIGNGSTVLLTLEGENTLESDENRAGLQTGDGFLEITVASISTGSLMATGGDRGAGVGSGESRGTGTNITVSGGSVKANRISGTPTNGITPVYLNTLTVGNPAVSDGVPVTAGSIGGKDCDEIPDAAIGVYGIRVVTIDGEFKVYFYLPETAGDERVELTAGGTEYGKYYTRGNSNDRTLASLLPYDIMLSETGAHDFPATDYGYGAQTPPVVTVINAGYNPTGTLDVALSGAGASAFMLFTSSIFSIDNGTDNFTVMPNTGFDAETYTATVTVSGVNSITASFDVSFTVDKVTPTLAVLDFILSDIACSGVPYPVPVAAGTDIAGPGEITVYYNGSAIAPVDPGEYTITIDIAEGANYTAVTGLPLGTSTIQEPPIPIPTRYSVLLPSAAGLTTDPPAGKYYVNGGTNFTFTLTPDAPSSDGTPPQVQTNRLTPNVPNAFGIRITPNADSSYTVVIISIRQDIKITFAVANSKSDPMNNESVAAGDLEVYAAPDAIVVANARPDAATLRVYNLAGTLVRLTAVPPGTVRLSAPPGIYIVTDGGVFHRKTAVMW
jgi:hypothetical protein